MVRNFNFAVGEYYHIYNRGNDRRNIFSSDKDRDRFMALLYLCNTSETIHLSDYPKSALNQLLDLPRSSTLVDIGTYCLMPNHFHLLIHESEEGGISRFMQKLLTGYTMYFNRRYQRSGSLLESSFRAKHIEDDEYLKYLFAYIHLNPVKIKDPDNWDKKVIPDVKKALDFLNNYPYSSFLDYLNLNRLEKTILNQSVFPEYFLEPREFEDFIKDWATYEDDLAIVKV